MRLMRTDLTGSYIALNGMGIGKDLEGIDRRILYVLPCCSPENCEEPKSELPVTRQRFEPGTF